MHLSRVLIVYKKSTLQLQGMEYKEPRFLKLMDENSNIVTRVRPAHDEHYQALEYVKAELLRREIQIQCLTRQEVDEMPDTFVKGFDLAIAVGGDGTFLDASHSLKDIPLLGVNSAPSSSFGHFCLAKESNFAQVLDSVQRDEIKPLNLLRLELILNEQNLSTFVLNEILISHSNPAGTSRYFIEVDGVNEEQRSSGIWIGPPSGSTGAIRAAGGKVLPISGRHFQFVVREPGERPHEKWQNLQAEVSDLKSLKLISHMRTGCIYVDGPHIMYPFSLGDKLEILACKYDLKAFIKPDINDMFSNK